MARRPSERSVLGVSVALIINVILASPVQAAAGALDPTFDSDGKVTTDFGSFELARGVAIHSNGQIVVAGAGGGDFNLARYNRDGSLDVTFDADGKVTTDFGFFDDAGAVAIQPGGKIVAAGAVLQNGGTDFALARYNTDGSLDASFDSDGKVTTDFGPSDGARAVAIQPNGKIVVAGDSGTGDFAVARYNTDGSLDASFDSDGKVTTDFGSATDLAFAVAIQPDGKIVAAGIGSPDGTDFAVARYNTDGSLDTSFDGDGRVTTDFGPTFDAAFAVAIQPNVKIVAAGPTGAGGGDFGLARYNTDGSLDTSFDGDGKVTTDFGSDADQARAVAIAPGGKIVAAGDSGAGDFALAKYKSDGSLDTSFDGDGKVTTDFGSFEQALGVAIQPDGRIVSAGLTFQALTGEDFALARYLAR